jgi:hypothetical protein
LISFSRRSYFRCTHRHKHGCHASKQVQRTDGDPLLFDVVYHGNHTCAQAQTAAHPVGNQARENSPPQPGLEQATIASPVLKHTVLHPFSLPSNNNPAAGANDNGCKTSSGFPAGIIAASNFMSSPAAQATPESQLVSSSSNYAVGVPNMPEVELASGTNSPMGDMVDFIMFPLDVAADFLENTFYDF